MLSASTYPRLLELSSIILYLSLTLFKRASGVKYLEAKFALEQTLELSKSTAVIVFLYGLTIKFDS